MGIFDCTQIGLRNFFQYQKTSMLDFIDITCLCHGHTQGLVKGVILCFRNPYFYFRHG